MANEETTAPATAIEPAPATPTSTSTATAPVLPAPAPYIQAAETIRSTAKWLVTAFAGVGAILVAGIPLTKLGDLQGWRFPAAALAIVIALGMIAYIIFKVAKVFTAPYITLANLVFGTFPKGKRRIFGKLRYEQDIRQFKRIMNAVIESHDQLYGDAVETLNDLLVELRKANGELRDAKMSVLSSDATNEKESDERLRAVEERQARVASAAERVVAFANYEAVRTTFEGTGKPMAVSALIVAAAIGSFAWCVGSEPPAPLRVTSPVRVLLSLDPKDDWTKLLGTDCNTATLISAVAIAGDFSKPTVVTTGDGGCKVARIDLTAKQGLAVPVVPPPPVK
jgi:hypothetical protein